MGFRVPEASAASTPNIATPLPTPGIFRKEMYPWSVHTPEPSPMCWGSVPRPASRSDTVSPQATVQEEPLVVSREFLRSVCEPFFDQMLSALQQAMQQKLCEDDFASMQATPQCRNQDSDSDDEETAGVEGLGAFASVLSGH